MNRLSKIGQSCLAAVILQLAICNLQLAIANDWPQFRGPNRDDVSKETGLLKKWPANGPPLLWAYKNAGVGYSGPAIVGDRLYTMGARNQIDFVIALDLKGNMVKEAWAIKIGPAFTWKGNNWNEGSSATPTVDGNLVYALGAQGELVCVSTAGKQIWRKNLHNDLGGEISGLGGGPEKIGWGYAGSPLVDGNRLICVPGGEKGTVAALDKNTGKLLWQSKELTEQATYSSPIVAEINGVRQYVVMTDRGAAGIRATDGSVAWRYERKPEYKDLVIPTPIFHNNHIYTTSFDGCDLIQLTAKGPQFTASNAYDRTIRKNMNNSTGGVVLVGDYLYGSSGEKRAKWVCQDLKSGKIVWSEGEALGKGSITYADGHLYCFSENDGIIALVEASEKGWTEKSRFEMRPQSKQRKSLGKIWTHPVVANGRLYLRDQELLFCYDVKDHKVQKAQK